MLAELEADGKLHLSLVYRGEKEDAERLLRRRIRSWKDFTHRKRKKGRQKDHESRGQMRLMPGTSADGMQDMAESEVGSVKFLKRSIFSRESGDRFSEEESESENQILAVWGSPGSGKTTVSVKLAAKLAAQRRDVALLLCDMNTPMLPCICPPGDIEEEHSLGEYSGSSACCGNPGPAQLYDA